jgi:hypothetical protein
VVVLFARGGVIGLLCGEEGRMAEPVLETQRPDQALRRAGATDDVSLDLRRAKFTR